MPSSLIGAGTRIFPLFPCFGGVWQSDFFGWVTSLDCELGGSGSALGRSINVQLWQATHDLHRFEAYGNHALEQLQRVGGIVHRL